MVQIFLLFPFCFISFECVDFSLEEKSFFTMKKQFVILAAVAMLLASCRPQEEEKNYVTIDFDELTLPSQGYLHQQAYQKETLPLRFGHSYNAEWDSWQGFVVSNQTDTETSGYLNQYSVAAGAAASGDNFALFFRRESGSPEIYEIAFTDASEHRFKSMAFCNATYPYLSMKNGDAFSKKFEDGDYFKLIIHGYDAEGVETTSKEIYLADFREGKQYLPNTWNTIDLTSLGEVNKLAFDFASSDMGIWGMNTPAYVCLDNIIFEE